MLYREIIAVCSEIHTKHINTLCKLNLDFFFFYAKPHGKYYSTIHQIRGVTSWQTVRAIIFGRAVELNWMASGVTHIFICRVFYPVLSVPDRTSSVTHRVRVEVTKCGTSCHAAGPVGHARAVLIGCPWLLADFGSDRSLHISVSACVSLLKHTFWKVKHCGRPFPFGVPPIYETALCVCERSQESTVCPSGKSSM